MVGWGMCGVLGAALALGARNAGRLTLAATCGFAGIAYGVLLNFSIMATYGGDLSIQRFLVLETRAIPFDAAHAIGNVAFALLAGPAMVRMLTRFRERFQWRTPSVVTALLVALVLPAAVATPASAAGAGSAADWLESVQNADGGFGTSPGSASSAAITGWAMLGLEAAGRNPLDIAQGGRTPVDFLRSNLDQLTSAGDLSRTILALEGAGLDSRDFGGRNLVSDLAKRRASNGSYVGWPGSTAYAVIALRTAGATGSLQKSLSWLGNVQNGDGGWGDVPGQPSNADVTGAVMQAMPSSQAAANGLTYLRKHQRSSGGFAGGSGEVNSQSTSWAAQGMIAFGADPAAVESGGNSALDYLAERQAADGHYSYSASSDQTPVWVTAEVLVAASGGSLPVPVPPRQPQPASPPASSAPPADSGAAPVAPAPELPSGTVPAPPSGGGSSGGSAAPPLVPEGVTPAPEGGGELPETGVAPPEPESPAPQAVASDGPPPSTEAAIGIGLAATALAIGVPWWLGRRNGW
ncbi:MAG TPA: prenyltransferase/squalene oxidase repeat-containing protein, partial [Solirubrobacterales bacterium]|nr:prenyltransferase/squalene oxidase repeat-containing protein [Solirubrobacterales bacterium]